MKDLLLKIFFGGKINLNNANLLIELAEFQKNRKLKDLKKKKQKRDTIENLNALYEGREMLLNAFKSGIFPLPPIEGTTLKVLTTKQMFQ